MKTLSAETRTATVRDLRNRFANVTKWIEEGEQVVITRKARSLQLCPRLSQPSRARLTRPRDLNTVRRWERSYA